MKVLLNVDLCDLEDKINRKIMVDENILLTDLCEYVIVSMDGEKIPIYELEYGKSIYLPYNIEKYENEKTLLELTLKSLNLKKGKTFGIRYNFDNFYYFDLSVDNFIDEDNDNKNIDFKVLSGKGYGIIDDCGGVWALGDIFSGENTDWGDYDINEFNLEKCNKCVKKVR